MCFALAMVLACASLPAEISWRAETAHRAWSFPAAVEGEHVIDGRLGIANDFEVVQPVTIWSLGVFDSEGDGMQGSTVIKVQLYASNPDRARKRASGVLLETVTFDAVDAGELIDGFRHKLLLRPVTLIPGQYTITAEGFDEQNPKWKKPEPLGNLAPDRIRVKLNDGGGLIRFTGCSHYHRGYFLKRTRVAKDISAPEHAPDRYAAATFSFLPAAHYASPFSVDYAALTAGVRSFLWDTNKSRFFSYRYGSIALLEGHAFPVIVEPSGSRLIFQAAGFYNGESGAARCVAFSDEQWADASSGERAALFGNAVLWAGRNPVPAEFTVGVPASLDARLLRKFGFRVVPVDGESDLFNGNGTPLCDVLVLDYRSSYSEQFVAQASLFVAAGGGLVVTCRPERDAGGGLTPTFKQINALLRPFGLACRPSLTQLYDLGITNLLAAPHPPILFNAFPAAELLRRDRTGQVKLTSLEKVLAMNSMAYAADGRPDLLTELAATYSGGSGDLSLSGTALGSFADLLVLSGAQANSSRLGQWRTEGTDLVALESRGAVEYDFEIPSAGMYRIQIFGKESQPQNPFSLLPSVDGIPLGQYSFQLPHGSGTLLALFAAKLGQPTVGTDYQTSDRIECLTPFLTPGSHKLRLFWNNANNQAQLRLQRIHVQSPVGADSVGDGLADWVRTLVDSQSGLDLTNAVLESHIAPFCLEGRDPFPGLMAVHVSGADKNVPKLAPLPAPNNRWYVNVPPATEGETAVHVSYQNGAKSDVRRLEWRPVNVLAGGHYTVRDGDSLLLVVPPEGIGVEEGAVAEFTIGTNQFTLNASSRRPQAFHGSGVVTVAGTYLSPSGFTRTGTITVNVVRHEFKDEPACWVGQEREWDIKLPPEATLEVDQRLFIEPLAQRAAGTTQNGLIIDQSEPRYFLSRLGTNGPVLASGVARGFDFWWAKDTWLRPLENFPDGSQLMETMLILNPVLPEVTVRVDVLVGGVLFEDGTTTRELTPADFDARGQCRVRFVRPADFKPSVCHSITLLQRDVVVGRVW